jgi:hypothetical protein
MAKDYGKGEWGMSISMDRVYLRGYENVMKFKNGDRA